MAIQNGLINSRQHRYNSLKIELNLHSSVILKLLGLIAALVAGGFLLTN